MSLPAFLKMLDAGKEGALLRYSLGNEYIKAGDAANAALTTIFGKVQVGAVKVTCQPA